LRGEALALHEKLIQEAGHTSNDLITLIANLALTLSFIVGLIFGIAQVRAAARDRRERLSLEALRSFQTRDFAELMNHINTHVMPSTRKEMLALPENEQVMFIQFAQEMETLGILVAERLINIDLVDKTLGSFISSSWDKYKPIILGMRESLPDPFLSEYFQWLAERIDRQMREHPRKPFYETRQ
jgi:hypothetical protein